MEKMYDIVTKIFEENGLDPEKIQGFSVPNESSVTITVLNLSVELKGELRRKIAEQAGIKEETVKFL